MSLQLLTPREREIVASLCRGNSNKLIARELNISEGTVKVHLNNIYTKVGISNRTTLVALTIVHTDTFEPRGPAPDRSEQIKTHVALAS
jgi:DNA-binding NarL/FixJ family response regulator